MCLWSADAFAATQNIIANFKIKVTVKVINFDVIWKGSIH